MADAVNSDENVSQHLPKSAEEVEFLKPIVAQLLRRIPDTWADVDSDRLNAAESRTLFLLVAAGLVERRFRQRCRMANHGTTFVATISATGEHGIVDACASLIPQMWTEWNKAYRDWLRGEAGKSAPFLYEAEGPEEWRLTDQGMIARDDLDKDQNTTGTVYEFVLRYGFFFNRQPVRGTGHLVSLHRQPDDTLGIKPSATDVRIANWEDCASAFSEQIGGLFDDFLRGTDGLPTIPELADQMDEAAKQIEASGLDRELTREIFHQLTGAGGLGPGPLTQWFNLAKRTGMNKSLVAALKDAVILVRHCWLWSRPRSSRTGRYSKPPIEPAKELRQLAIVLRDQSVNSSTTPDIKTAKSTTKPHPRPWWKDGPPPSGSSWFGGDVLGTKKELQRWCHGRKTSKAMEAAARGGAIWIWKQRGQSYSAYFRTQSEYAAANGVRLAEQSKTQTNAKPTRRKSTKKRPKSPKDS